MDLWNNVLKNVRAGLMPPADKPRPTAAELKTLETWIKRDAFRIDPASPDPGRVTLRRLNRTEYRNTVRDLMGYDFRADEEFPADDSGYGFDNIGDVLSVSPLLLEKYLQAAETIVAAAVPLVPKVVRTKNVAGAGFHGAGGVRADALSFYKEAKATAVVRRRQDGRLPPDRQPDRRGRLLLRPRQGPRHLQARRPDDRRPGLLLGEQQGRSRSRSRRI